MNRFKKLLSLKGLLIQKAEKEQESILNSYLDYIHSKRMETFNYHLEHIITDPFSIKKYQVSFWD
ncbi:hypothetical protein P700755_001973 [Psychroflexus torquis ATCC 700755]|uniref:Uncharacterized protein n=1 Tax=Psychroflexus torquis (strain ATCC 700755 / CIP 106069 / ACAM 623) TaxID=313595 RepID=K4ITG1_PSYTT|nr:hypothetical protein [Psychroflexus torquis]AFU68770.1 hypothetical protein P700755_001973 [Psychroflexus torquis ATCC 700755]